MSDLVRDISEPYRRSRFSLRRRIMWTLALRDEQGDIGSTVDVGVVKFWFNERRAVVLANADLNIASALYRERSLEVGRARRTEQEEAERDVWRQQYTVETGDSFYSTSANSWSCFVEVRRPNGLSISMSEMDGLRVYIAGGSAQEARDNARAYGWSHWVECDLDRWMSSAAAKAPGSQSQSSTD